MKKTKQCIKCEQVLPLTDYHMTNKAKGIRANTCKYCKKEYRSKHYQRNREKEILARREYYRENLEACAEYKRKWRLKNKENIARKEKEYKAKNLIKIRAKRAVYDAVKSGKLIKASNCEACGSDKYIEGHHFSYARDKWLDVIWLCNSCHQRLHKGII